MSKAKFLATARTLLGRIYASSLSRRATAITRLYVAMCFKGVWRPRVSEMLGEFSKKIGMAPLAAWVIINSRNEPLPVSAGEVNVSILLVVPDVQVQRDALAVRVRCHLRAPLVRRETFGHHGA